MTYRPKHQLYRDAPESIPGIGPSASSSPPDMREYRESDAERQRTADLLRLAPERGGRALDLGARDGHFALRLADRFHELVALDLTRPDIEHPRVACVQGDVRNLSFADDSFDFVLCAEVLEHIPPENLKKACAELARVCRGHLLIGVPYRQDIRFGRTTCVHCGTVNPPWGHVNSFDTRRLLDLFPGMTRAQTSFVGSTRARTNALSAWLMNRAGNPYGTYTQDEPCIACGRRHRRPGRGSLYKRIMNRTAFDLMRLQNTFSSDQPQWIHVLFTKA